MLMPGDLIFFDTAGGGGKKISHVGIYVGDGMMIHSSSSKGVIVSDINADYFKRTFAGAGYVEKYRDMIASNTPKPSPAQQPSKNSGAVTVEKRNEAAAEESFTLSPVTSLPTRKITPAATGTPKTAEPTPEEARKKVLNTLIEQKLDSIFNR